MGKIGKAWRWLGGYGRDRRGNISTLVALLIVLLLREVPLAGREPSPSGAVPRPAARVVPDGGR